MVTGIGDKTVIVVVGPTASGKTVVAIELAKHLNTEIISADSRQCFKEMKIGVARPSEDELKMVTHHFIASHSVTDEMNAALFEQNALNKTGELFIKYNSIVMVGGTGLYIKAFCEGMDNIPEINPEVRKKIILDYEQNGLQWLQEQVKQKDLSFFETGEVQNPQRMMRALEVVESTGQSILSFRKRRMKIRGFNIVKIGLELSREELYLNINTRVDNMIEEGLVEEVKKLNIYKHLNALRTVGYSEIFDYLDGNILFPHAIDLIKKNTRQYAKRQLTWFRKDEKIKWVMPGDFKKIKEALM